MTPPWPASRIPRAWGGGEGGEGGVGRPEVPRRPPPVPWFISLAAAVGWLEGPCPDPPVRWLCGAARPPLQRALPGLFGIPGRRSRPRGLAAGGSVPAVTPAHVPRGRPGGGGGQSVCRPLSGASLGGPWGRWAGGHSASVRPPASLERAPKRASSASLTSWRVWSPYCSGSCLCAAARMRSAGCPCAPAQD